MSFSFSYAKSLSHGPIPTRALLGDIRSHLSDIDANVSSIPEYFQNWATKQHFTTVEMLIK